MQRVILGIIAIPLSYLFYLIRNIPIRENLNYIDLPQQEATKIEDLLYQSDGYLNEVGWSKKPIKPFNTSQISYFQYYFRLKKWDLYQITTDDFYLSINFIDLSYRQDIEFSYYDFQSNKFINKQYLIIPFFNQLLNLSDDLFISDEQIVNFTNNEMSLLFKGQIQEVKTEMRMLSLIYAADGIQLSAELKFETSVEDERLVISTPINSKRNQWSYAQKAYNWDVNGNVDFQMSSYEILESNSNVAYKWERGIWNYHTFWLWASGQGYVENGRRFALNLGGGFQDAKEGKATEEAIYLDKQIYKLKNLEYSYDLTSESDPFIIKTQKIEKDHMYRQFNFYCEFTPKKMIKQDSEMIIFQLHIQRYYGEFTGFYVQENASILRFEKIFGIIEINKSAW